MLRDSVKNKRPPINPEDQLTDLQIQDKLKEAITKAATANISSLNVPEEFLKFVKKYTGNEKTTQTQMSPDPNNKNIYFVALTGCKED